MYDFALIDPPYEYDNRQMNDPKRGGIGYSTLSMKQLTELPISKIMNKNSLIAVWATFPKLCNIYNGEYSFFNMIRAWGFNPVTALFVWVKTTKKGKALNEDDNLLDYNSWYSGLGYYVNSNAEVCFVARRGKGLERSAKNVKQLIFAPISDHSAKPKEQYSRIEALYPNKKYIELFARKINPPPSNWDATGLDYDGKDIREYLRDI